MAEQTHWRLDAVSDGRLLRCSSGPAGSIEIPWRGPPSAAYAEFERVSEWHTHEYTSTCECIVRIYAADGTLLGELAHQLAD